MTEDAVLDWDRRRRVGLDEAILCAGKSAGQIADILDEATEKRRPLLFTRLDPDSHAALAPHHQAALDYDPMSRTAILGDVPAPDHAPQVAVVTAGTSDLPMTREVVRTLGYYGEPAAEYADVGVAGLHRLLDRIEAIRAHPVIVVAAGMDGALPSVLAGLVPGLVIALPTSTGYGAARGGETALAAMLTSCAPGLVVVNIDNGYGAACAALRALHLTAPR